VIIVRSAARQSGRVGHRGGAAGRGLQAGAGGEAKRTQAQLHHLLGASSCLPEGAAHPLDTHTLFQIYILKNNNNKSLFQIFQNE